MTLQQIRYLAAVADHGHFGRAAKACYVSQPTLSSQIRKLEEFLGVKVFERTNRKVMLTPIGEEIIAAARKTLEQAARLRRIADRDQEPFTTPLRLGVIPTLNPYLLPWLMPAFQRRYPRGRLRVREDLTANLLDGLKRHQLDAALLALPVDDPGLEVSPLFEEPFWLICPAGHPLSGKQSVRETDLAGHRLLLLSEGHCLRDQALALCDKRPRDESGEDDFRATSIETVRQMVAAGFGCTLLPALALAGPAAKTPGIRPVPFVADAKASRRVGLARRRNFHQRKAIDLLGECIRECLPRGVTAIRQDANHTSGRSAIPAER